MTLVSVGQAFPLAAHALCAAVQATHPREGQEAWRDTPEVATGSLLARLPARMYVLSALGAASPLLALVCGDDNRSVNAEQCRWLPPSHSESAF
jgi:hypothetical protein